MIKKFRIRFIAVAMASIFLVLSVILGVMNVVNYRRVVQEADNTLKILVDNNGTFPEQEPGDNPAKKEDEDNAGKKTVEEPPAKPEDEKEESGKQDKPGMSPELPFESRYFSVVLDEDNKKVSADTGKIAAINEKTAVKYAKKVALKSKTSGFYSGYRYQIK